MATKPKRSPIWTARQFETLRPEAEPYDVKDRDTKGLYVRVWPSGVKSWFLFFQWQGKQAKLVLGEMSLADARVEAGATRKTVKEGLDPREGKRVAKAIIKRERKSAAPAKRSAAAPSPSKPIAAAVDGPETPAADKVDAVVAAYIERHAKPHKRTWRESARLLDKDFTPGFAGRRFADLTADDFQSCVDAVADRGAPILANRVFAELSKLCKWAASRRVRLIPENRFRDIEKPLASEKSRARERVLSDRELSLVLRAAEKLRFPWREVVWLLVLTGARRMEVAGMDWGEVDMDEAVWTLPPARTKNKRSHALPLSPAAIAILRSAPRFARRSGQTDFIFGLSPPRSFSDTKRALDKEVARLNNGNPIQPWTFHDLRRSAVTGLAKLGTDLHVIERIVNHVSGSFGGIVGTYQKHRFEKQMREALNLWADHLTQLGSQDSELTPSELTDA
jgi:integrase